MASFDNTDNAPSFTARESKYSCELEMAIAEAEAIATNDDATLYDNMEDLKKALLS